MNPWQRGGSRRNWGDRTEILNSAPGPLNPDSPKQLAAGCSTNRMPIRPVWV